MGLENPGEIKWTTCGGCHGQGKVTIPDHKNPGKDLLITCEDCNGKGKIRD